MNLKRGVRDRVEFCESFLLKTAIIGSRTSSKSNCLYFIEQFCDGDLEMFMCTSDVL